ncbi:MAG: hypothetical protein CL930_08900 [Deltaproteobacteria bacterium]|nr:hypothetical protein [Deltaproteobacteria bacterium]
MLTRPFFCLMSFPLLFACSETKSQNSGGIDEDNDRGSTVSSDTSPPDLEPEDTAASTVDPDSGVAPGPEDAIGNDASTAAVLSDITNWDWEVPLAFDAIDHDSDVDVYRLEMVMGTILFIAAESVDTVDLELRLFDAEGRAQGTSKMMPNRAWGDDPGIWLQARYSGTLFVEVSATESPISDANYRLRGTRIEAEDGEPNDTISDANTRFEDGTAGFRASMVDPAEQTEFLGMFQSSGDVDVWAIQVPSTGVMTWSFWPLGTSSLDPEVILYDEGFNPIAWGKDCRYSGSGLWYDDVGIMYPVVSGQRLYLSVSNLRPSSGPGSLYVGAQQLLDSPSVESEPNDDLTTSNWATMTASATHPGYRHWTMQGMLNQPDEKDVVAFSNDEVGGQYVSFHLQAGSLGSGLQAQIAVYGGGDGTTALATASSDASGDLSLTDVLVPADSVSGVYLEITGWSRAVESFGNQYFLGVESYPVPLHE